MKNQKKVKATAPQIITKGSGKKKAWPWLLALVAVLALVGCYAVFTIQFFTAPQCIGHTCDTLSAYLGHVGTLLNIFTIVAGVTLLFAILYAIFTPRKRKVIVEAAPVKYVKATEPQYLATGVFKKRVWPWLLVIAAVLTVVVPFALVAIEFFTAPRCGVHCATYYDYLTVHYTELANLVLIIAGALLLFVILCTIFFVRKRHLTLSATTLTYKKGRKTVEIPLDSIKSIDTGISSLIVTVPHVKFKFSKLKNKKEFYDALLTQMNAPMVTTTTVIAPAQSLTAMAAPLLANPTLQGKLAYFGKLYESGLITPQQYDKYVQQSYNADC